MEDQQAPQSAEGEAKVITLCGSTKFQAEFAEVNQRLTMEGHVVISVGMFSLPDLPDYDWTADSSDLKGRLGDVHFQKIRMAEEVYIVDPGGYVGESTRREIAYAVSLGKPVRYLSRERLARTGDGPQEHARPRGPLIGTTARNSASEYVANMSRSHLLLIGGRSGVGKTTVAAEVHRELSERGIHHAWIEGDNLDMAFPVPWKQGYALAEANLAAMWSNYRAHAYTRLIYVNTASVVGPVIDDLATAMGDHPSVTGVLLTSSDKVAEQRLVQREVGSGFDYAVGRSREAALGLETDAPEEVTRLNTDGHSVADLAAQIIELTGWCLE